VILSVCSYRLDSMLDIHPAGDGRQTPRRAVPILDRGLDRIQAASYLSALFYRVLSVIRELPVNSSMYGKNQPGCSSGNGGYQIPD
jgi:hypothetical protein